MDKIVVLQESDVREMMRQEIGKINIPQGYGNQTPKVDTSRFDKGIDSVNSSLKELITLEKTNSENIQRLIQDKFRGIEGVIQNISGNINQVSGMIGELKSNIDSLRSKVSVLEGDLNKIRDYVRNSMATNDELKNIRGKIVGDVSNDTHAIVNKAKQELASSIKAISK